MRTEAIATRVATHALGRRPCLGATRLICIDGPAGSGKTQTADELMTRFGHWATLIRLEDLYAGWRGMTRIDEEVPRLLTQIATGRATGYRRYDWFSERIREWVHVPPRPVMVMEGCGAAGLAWRQATSTTVWLQTSREDRTERGIRRDASVVPDTPALREHWRRWSVEEDARAVMNRMPHSADLVVTTAR